MKSELLVVESTPALLSTNFDDVKKHLEKELAKYDVVVTAETLKDGKELSTTLNKMATDIDTRRKEEVAKVSKPIKDFDENMKSLVKLCKDGRVKLLDQIKVFEDETRAKIKQMMIDLREHLYNLNEVEEEFRTFMLSSSIPLGYLTSTGKLSGKIQSEIKHGVLACLQVQKDVEMRLIKLENESYKAGLKSPLSKVHVQAFLFDDEAQYQEKLAGLLAVEVKRQEATEEKMREQANKETVADKVEHDNHVCAGEPPSLSVKPEVIEKPEAPTGMIFYVLQARFEISVKDSVKPEAIVNALRKRIEDDAKITTLKSVEVIA